jgi:hypothetical protein
VAKPNYSFEKRQREMAKKKKKEEKDREKAARKANPQPGDGAVEPDAETEGNEGAAEGGSGGGD